jgi:hypothetical protein
MNEVKLTGIQVGSPVGFMAALGLLRVLNEDHSLDVTLAWRSGHAILGGIDEDALLTRLNEHMSGRSRALEFNFAVNTGSDKPIPVLHLREIRPEDYQAATTGMAEDARALGFLAGFATDTVVNDKGFVARTAFDFSSAQQKLAEEFRRLAIKLDPDAKRGRKEIPAQTLLQRGLFGGAYVEQHSFGWDPATLMSHGYAAIAPTHAPTPAQPCLVWLAVESLPWHPVLPDGRGRALTTGWDGRSAYAWPEWHMPLTAAEVRMLRARPVGTLALLPGIAGIWSSQRTGVGKFGFFHPAARTFSPRENPGRFAQ